MTIRHPLWYENPPPSEEEAAAAFVGERPTVPGGRIVVAEPDPGWPTVFEGEWQRLIATIGDRALRVSHVGSTSVPGLPAKPIIDIDLVVADSDDEPAYLPDLEKAGYLLGEREFRYTQDYNEAKHAFIAELLDRIYAVDLAAHPGIGVEVPG